MVRYLLTRAGYAVAVVWLAYTFTFVAIELLPSDPITVYLSRISEGSTVDPTLVEAMKQYYGFDRPLPLRYLNQLWLLGHGNFGYSLNAARPVTERIGEVIAPTVTLAVSALTVALLIAASVVTVAVLATNATVRSLTRSVPALFSAIPTFWLGLVALQVLSFQLGVMTIFPDGSLLSQIVPAVVLGIPLSAPFTQVLLKSVDTAYQQPYVSVARAKGATERQVFFTHVVKAAAAPGLTMIGLATGTLLTGTVVTETVFSRSGVGKVLEEAVSRQDVALVQGFVLLSAVIFVTINLVVDLIYPLLDPRVTTVPRRKLAAGSANELTIGSAVPVPAVAAVPGQATRSPS